MTDKDGSIPDRLARRRKRNGEEVDRRRFLRHSTAASAVAASAASAGCSDLATSNRSESDDSRTMFVFNTGDSTVSIVDVSSDDVVETVHIGATSSYPANQYAAVERDDETLWINVEGGVRGFTTDSLDRVVELDTGADANWQEITPDGAHLIVSAREPTHAQYKVDADPASETFGEVTEEIDREEAGPCDVTIGPDGRYAYVPDIWADTLTVVDVDAFEVAAQVDVDPVLDGVDEVNSYMGTAAWSGEWLAVENAEGDHGTESIWDISTPEEPEELYRFTEADGLGAGALTSEVGPDSETLYVFTRDSNDVTVIDVPEREVVDRIDVGGSVLVGSWDPNREKLYAPVQDADDVAVIEHASGEVVDRIEVGAAPVGVTARRVRPDVDTTSRFRATLSRLGVRFDDEETTFCYGDCYCGSSCE